MCSKKRTVGRFIWGFSLTFPRIELEVFLFEKGSVRLALRTCLNHLMRGCVCVYFTW